MPVQPLLRQRAAELLLEAGAGAELLQPPEHAQLRDQLVGVVEHRRAGQRQPQLVRPHRLRQSADGARPLRRRVLAVVRLVEHERLRPQPRERLAMMVEHLVVEDRYLVRSRHDLAALDDADAAMGQPVARLALPVELQRGGADDDRRVGVVGLQRGERLDRLAEALLVGEEGAAGIEHVADAGPLERLQLAAQSRGRRLQRRRLGRARASDLRGGARVLLAQPAQGALGREADLDVVQADEVLQRLQQPRVDRDGPLALAAGQVVEGEPGGRVPQHLQPQPRALDAVGPDQPRRRRHVAQLQRRDGAVGGGVELGRLLLAQQVGVLLGQRDQQRAVLLARERAVEQPLRHLAGERLQDEPAAAVVTGRADAAEPAALDAVEPFPDALARRQLREPSQQVGDVQRDPGVDRRPPLVRVPVEAAMRDAAHRLDEVAVVGEGEDDDPPPFGVVAQVDVRAFGDELHHRQG